MILDTFIVFFQENPFMYLLTIGVISLMVGSFLNVVIWRLPLMLKAEWIQECFGFLEENKLLKPEDKITPTSTPKPFNLWHPRSHCPKCEYPLRIWDNIPVFSYIFLAGKCKACSTSIPLRYPFIEILCCILSITTVFYFGVSLKACFGLLLTWSLISLAWIDIEHKLLPDNITLPILWLGLAVNLNGIFTDLSSALIGAMAGYLSLWSIFWLFKLITGKDGMGYGDFKLAALLGAWLGWQALPEIILLASFVGAVIGISMIGFQRIKRTEPIPFGPFLALAGWISLNWGDTLRSLYLSI